MILISGDWQAMVMSPGVELEENHRSKKGEKACLMAFLFV